MITKRLKDVRRQSLFPLHLWIYWVCALFFLDFEV